MSLADLDTVANLNGDQPANHAGVITDAPWDTSLSYADG